MFTKYHHDKQRKATTKPSQTLGPKLSASYPHRIHEATGKIRDIPTKIE